jgi:hypothetical protein
MLTLNLDQKLETRVLKIAQQQQQTPEQLITDALTHYLYRKQATELLVNAAMELPVIEAFANQDPLAIQQAMRDEWR